MMSPRTTQSSMRNSVGDKWRRRGNDNGTAAKTRRVRDDSRAAELSRTRLDGSYSSESVAVQHPRAHLHPQDHISHSHTLSLSLARSPTAAGIAFLFQGRHRSEINAKQEPYYVI